ELGQPKTRDLAFRLFRSRRLVGAALRALAVATAPLRRNGVLRLPAIGRLARGQLSWRTPPAIPFRPARARLSRRLPQGALAETEVTGKTVGIFLQCLTDRLAPAIAESTVALLEAAGARVVVPETQHCCGLPAFDSGDWPAARRMARQTI